MTAPALSAALPALEPREIDAAEDLRLLKRALAERLGEPPIAPAERALALAEVCRRWREPDDRGRRAVLASLVEQAGYAPATAAAGLDASLAAWKAGAWLSLAAALPDSHARGGAARQSAEDAGVIPHILGSALPGPNVLPIFFTLLAGGAALVRVGRHLPGLPAVAIASLAEVDPRLAGRAAACRWPRERSDLTRVLFAGARVGSATGADASTAAVASAIEPGTRLLTHPHRVSFAYVGAAAAGTPADRARVARRLAVDVALHDQQGCLSPAGILVEGKGAHGGAAAFAQALAAALEEQERRWPRAALDAAASLAVRGFHDALALREARGEAARVLAGGRLAWVVAALEEGSVPVATPQQRCVWVRAVTGPREALRVLARWRGSTAALGVAGGPALRRRARSLARALGAIRVVPVGRMQSPPLAWRQDGLHPVLDLLPRAPRGGAGRDGGGRRLR